MTPEIAAGSKVFRIAMKLVAVFAALLLAAACTAAGALDAAPEYRVVSSGGYASSVEEAAELVVRDESAYVNAWRSRIGEGEAPSIDFATETAVFLFGGQRPTGGYSVEVKGVTIDGRTLVVDGGVAGPPPGGMATQAITSPYVVLAVKSRDLDAVRWQR